MRNQHFVTKKYTVARLDEISTMDVKPLYLVYRELNKCISEVIRSISPFALAFEFMVNELKEENPKNTDNTDCSQLKIRENLYHPCSIFLCASVSLWQNQTG